MCSYRHCDSQNDMTCPSCSTSHPSLLPSVHKTFSLQLHNTCLLPCDFMPTPHPKHTRCTLGSHSPAWPICPHYTSALSHTPYSPFFIAQWQALFGTGLLVQLSLIERTLGHTQQAARQLAAIPPSASTCHQDLAIAHAAPHCRNAFCGSNRTTKRVRALRTFSMVSRGKTGLPWRCLDDRSRVWHGLALSRHSSQPGASACLLV